MKAVDYQSFDFSLGRSSDVIDITCLQIRLPIGRE